MLEDSMDSALRNGLIDAAPGNKSSSSPAFDWPYACWMGIRSRPSPVQIQRAKTSKHCDLSETPT